MTLSARTHLQSLQLFVAVVDEGGVNRAAAVHHLAPSAVSKHIAALEDHVGAKLFVRMRGRLTLNPAGELLLYHARRVLAAANTMETEMRGLRHGIANRVVVSCNVSALNLGLASHIESFNRVSPNVVVTLREGRSEEVVAALHDRSSDLGVFATTAGSHGLLCTPWATSRLAVVFHADRGIPDEHSIAFAELLAHPFVVLGDGSEPDAMGQMLQRSAAKQGREMSIRMLVTSVAGLTALISADVGIAVLPECTTRVIARQPGIVSVPLADDWAKLGIQIGVRQDATLGMAAWALRSHLMAASPEMLA